MPTSAPSRYCVFAKRLCIRGYILRVDVGIDPYELFLRRIIHEPHQLHIHFLPRPGH